MKLFKNKTTDTKSQISSVSEPLLAEPFSGSPAEYRAGRLYQFSTKPNYQNEMIFGTIFELNFQKESKDLDIIYNKISKEIKHLEKIAEEETKQGKLVINKAIENNENLIIWKLEQYENKEGVKYIRKCKLCTYKELANAKKSEQHHTN